jgi:hypothetical protein
VSYLAPGTRFVDVWGKGGVVTRHCTYGPTGSCVMVRYDGRDYDDHVLPDTLAAVASIVTREKQMGRKTEEITRLRRKNRAQKNELRRLNKAMRGVALQRDAAVRVANRNEELRRENELMKARVADAEATINQVRSPKTHGSITVGSTRYLLIKAEDL